MIKSLEKPKIEPNDISCIDDWLTGCMRTQDVLSKTVRLFKGVNIESPRLDAELLLANVMDCNPIDLYIDHNLKLDECSKIHFTEMARKRAKRMPIQYILGHSEFMSLDFVIDKNVLIPRPETELIVESVLEIIEHRQKNVPVNIIDLCTGSGNIGVSICVMLKDARVYASDISPEALNVARTNAIRHKVEDRMIFLQGDIFTPFKAKCIDLKADFIVSNPPYVAEYELDALQPEIIRHEPYRALAGGNDGLDFFRIIISEADNWVNGGGYLILEIGNGQLDDVLKLISACRSGSPSNGFRFINAVKDLQGIDRIVIAQKT